MLAAVFFFVCVQVKNLFLHPSVHRVGDGTVGMRRADSRSAGAVFATAKQRGVKVSNLIFCFHQTRTIPPSPSKPYRNPAR